ncbi:N2,N2-dimethylguanosine tRNA methyltransferase, partial [mine drainage metagenome]
DLIEGDVRSKLGESITSVQGADTKEIKFAERIASEPNTPFYYSIPKLTKLMGLPSVSELSVIEGLLGKNYKASLTHFEKNCVKTDAPLEEIKSLITGLSKGRF